MDREIEAKFYVSNLHEIRNRLYCQSADLVQLRTRLLNDRYDTAGGELAAAHQVLRIRAGNSHQLTFKGPDDAEGARLEIEFDISDPAAAHRLLSALGYRRFSRYETFRETFRLGELLIMLDELPFGTFVEIEGPSMQAVEELAGRLQLDWFKRVPWGYNRLFLDLKKERELDFDEATFENFAAEPAVCPADLGVEPAD